MAAIITKMNRLNDCTVAIDGSVFVNYPHYANRMKDALREVVGIAAENIVLAQGNDNLDLIYSSGRFWPRCSTYSLFNGS